MLLKVSDELCRSAATSRIDFAADRLVQKQQVDVFEMDVIGKKPAGASPSIYRSVHLKCRFEGDVSEKKIRRAIDLSLGKYCSIADLLKQSGAEISYSFSVNGEIFEGQTF